MNARTIVIFALGMVVGGLLVVHGYINPTQKSDALQALEQRVEKMEAGAASDSTMIAKLQQQSAAQEQVILVLTAERDAYKIIAQGDSTANPLSPIFPLRKQ